jgi:hypothetical protein
VLGIPVRLRGHAPAYPWFWRAGTVDPATAGWRPRGPWGVPVSLSGARVHGVRAAGRADGLVPTARDDRLITAVDRDGRFLQLATRDRAGSALVERAMSEATSEPGAGPARLRWLRNRAPLHALVLALLGVLWIGYQAVPLIGATLVDAVVVSNPGEGYLCEVAWVDPSIDRTGHGYVDCGDRRPGERVRVHAMGWPRQGTADDVSTVLVLALPVGLTGLLIAGLMIGGPAAQVRRAAQDLRTAGKAPSSGSTRGG